MKRNRIWILLGGLILLTVLFSLANFHLSFSKNSVSRNSVTTGIGADMPAAVQQRDNIMVIVEGKGGMVTALEKALRSQISAGGIANPVITEAVEPGNKNPVLLVKIADKQVFWTPVYGSSNVQALVGYASNGDLELIQNLPLENTNLSGASIMMSGEYKLTGRSFGFISLPGYHRMLAQAIVASIMLDLQAIYSPN